MEITVAVNRDLKGSRCFLTSGSIIIIGSKVVKFKQNEEQKHKQSVFDIKDIEIIKSKEATYEIEFINKYDEYYGQNNAKIQIKNGSSFYTHLNLFQRIKLKWMRNEYDIQSKEIKIEILKYFLTILLSFIGGIFYERNQIEKATPEITPKNAPKAVVNTSLENKIFKKSIKKDTIIVK